MSAQDDFSLLTRVHGRGGGGGKKGGGGKDADNTLRSKARARMIELLSDGPIDGLVDGERSIFFDQTPLRNLDGTYNFKNVIWEEHKGHPDEGYFKGHGTVETPHSVEVEVKASVGPVQRTIVDQNADGVRVILRIPALFYQNKDKGRLETASVSYAIDVRNYGGAWREMLRKDIRKEKTTSPYQIAHYIDLPHGTGPWDLRIRRLTPDSEKDELQNETWWEGYVVCVEGKFTLPHSAAIAMEVNAEDMGSSIPPRSFHIRGLRVNVPSNYEPSTRTYTGIWDGTFKIAWTNNPAWVFYDLITNDRYGLGEFVPAEIVDKWSLYTIAQYCDQEVKSGYKNGDTGEDIMEPRFTYNGVINSRDEAYFVLQQVASAWRGMAYWSLGQVFASSDMPADPVKLVSPANVINGEFNYSGTAMKARHSVCIVKWNDPDDFYRPSTEVVINQDMLQRFGWREKTLQLNGCTSRGLAHRYGKWVLDVEQHETETVEYQASWDHADLRPGQIISISDPYKAQVRAGGRVLDVSDDIVTLDAPFEPTPTHTYSLMITNAKGKLERRSILAFLPDNKLRLESPFDEAVLPNAMFALTGTDITPRQYRVLAIDETEQNVFRITALFHDQQKYDRIEKDILFDPLPYSRPENVSYPPSNLVVREVGYTLGNNTVSKLHLSWTPNPNFLAKGFRISVETPDNGLQVLGETDKTWIELDNIVAGEYTFLVQSIAYTGLPSEPATIFYEAMGPEGIPLPTISGLRLADRPGSNEFIGRDVHIAWDNNFATSSDPLSDSGAHKSTPSTLYSHNIVRVYDSATNTLLREQTVYGAAFTYTFDMNRGDSSTAGFATPRRALRFEVSLFDAFGRKAANDATAVFTNPVPAPIAPAYFINGDTIYFSFPGQDDPDFEGVLVWRETSSGFNPLTTEPSFDISTNSLTVPGEPRTDYWFRVAGYDAFGKTDLNISNEIHIQTGSNGVDTEPPAVPTGLAVTSTIIESEPGFVRVDATWNANTDDDLAGYDVQIKEGSGNWVSFVTSATGHNWRLRPNVDIQVRVAAFDKLGNKSEYSTAATHKTARDTVAPAMPANPVAKGGVGVVWLEWSPNTEADFSHYEIYQSDTQTPAPTAATVPSFTSNTTTRAIGGLTGEDPIYFWIRSVDTSGNKSAWTARLEAAPTVIDIPEPAQVLGITFTPGQGANGNRLDWSTGQMAYGDGPTVKAISAGNATWSSGTLYVYYVEGETVLRTATALATVYTASGNLIGLYKGGLDFQLVGGDAMIDGSKIIARTIGANQLVADEAVITGSAQIGEAIINDAHIQELSAGKLKADSALAGTITVGDKPLQTIREEAETGASDPAERINAGTTQIDPGRIIIAGETSLADWRSGPDSTEINGASISTGTISGEKLTIGMRGITVEGLQFEHNKPGANQVSWTAGVIRYVGDDGNIATRNISAGSATWASGTLYIYWVKDASALSSHTSLTTAIGPNNITMAAYRGNTDLVTDYGRTVIDGSILKTGTVIADQVAADSIGATHIKSDAIDTRHIKADAIDADKINVTQLSAIAANLGSITGGSLNINNRFIVNSDGTTTIRSSTSGARLEITGQRILLVDNT